LNGAAVPDLSEETNKVRAVARFKQENEKTRIDSLEISRR
jgi:hypothetical protein